MSAPQDLRSIASQFQVRGEISGIAPHGNGHINETHLVTCRKADVTRFILQRINRNVFPDPAAVMENIERVTAHLAAQLLGEPDRARRVLTLIPAKDLLAEVLRRRVLVRAIAINADQAPAATERHQWISFLGQETAFYVGPEQIARSMRLPMLYVSMRRLRRGVYEAELRELWDGREATVSGELTARYARACEADVRASPADWLWTYRRWRFPKPLYGAGAA
jgi:lauroyl/myristoyl acyltransferase